jgi:NADH-quinone oxidoreductase subunit M
MSELPILSIIVFTPAVAAVAVAVAGRDPRVSRAIALLAGVVCLAASVWVFVNYDRAQGGFQFAESLRWIPSLGASYSVAADGISASMVLLAGIITFAAVLMSWDVRQRQREYFTLLLLTLGAVFGVFVARDAFLLLFFYEIASVPMYLLIALWGSTRREYAAMKLMLFLFAGSAMLIVTVALTYWQVGAHTFSLAVWSAHAFPAEFQKWVFLLALVGFSVKIPAVPVHTWLPDGHSAAPTAVSAILAGVLLKIGAYGLIRMGLTLFPSGWAEWADLMAIVGVIGIVYGALCAMNQRDLKYLIGYSSVSHMGYVILGLGIGTSYALSGAVFQMFSHGVTTALFFGLVGYIYDRTHTRMIPELSGITQRAPLIAVGFVIAALSSMAFPSTSGFVAELLVYLGTAEKMVWLIPFALVGVIVTAALLLRFLGRSVFGTPSAAVDPISDAPPLAVTPLALLAGAIMFFGIFPASMYDAILDGVKPILLKLAGG